MTANHRIGGMVLPPGLKLAHEFVTPDEERELIALIEGSGIAYVDYDPGNPRCERTFGWEYDYPNDTILPGDPLPACFRPLRDRAAAFAGVASASLIQCLLLRYDPGSLIQPHCDKPVWSNVLGLSLGSPATMVFRKELAEGDEVIAVELPPRSVYLQTGEARFVWQHSMPVVARTRWGVTFRDFSNEGFRQSERFGPVSDSAN